MEYRRLNPTEARRLGVSYSAKRMVPKSLRRVTKATKTISNRQVAQQKLGTSKEKFAKSRITRTKMRNGGEIITRNNLSPRELPRVLRAAKGHNVVLIMLGEWGGEGYKGDGKLLWRYGVSSVPAEDLLDPDDLEAYEKDSGLMSNPVRYSVVIR